MTHLARWLAFCIGLSFILAPLSFARAQDEPTSLDAHPLLEMLALVPDIDAVRLAPPGESDTSAPWIMFVNFRAALDANPDFPPPANFADYVAQIEQGRENWGGVSARIATATYSFPILPLLSANTSEEGTGSPVGEVMEALTGMDYFDIHTGMFLGSYGMIFGGNLDLDAIGAAHTARDYTENSVQGLRVWCSGKVGCEGGNSWGSPDSVEQFNVFDSIYGRQPPFFGLEGSSANYLAGAFDYDLLLTMVGAAADASDSLASAADYRTLVSVLLEPERYTGALIQVNFIPAPVASTPFDLMAHVQSWGSSLNEWTAPPEWADYGSLPAYQLMALADRQEGDNVVTMVALLYPDSSDAEAALPELTARLTTYTGVLERQTTEPLLSYPLGNPAIWDSYVYTDPETGWAVAVVTLRNDFSFVSNLTGKMTNNINLLYPVYTTSIRNKTFYPLWVADFSNWQAWGN